MEALTKVEKQSLKAQAHHLEPLVWIAEKGLSPTVLEAVDDALRDHELIKVRLRAPKDKKDTATTLAEKVDAHLIGLIGHTIILYRKNPEKAEAAAREPAKIRATQKAKKKVPRRMHRK